MVATFREGPHPRGANIVGNTNLPDDQQVSVIVRQHWPTPARPQLGKIIAGTHPLICYQFGCCPETSLIFRIGDIGILIKGIANKRLVFS